MHPLRAAYDRSRVLVHEVTKFGIVGVVNTVLDFGLFNVLHFAVGLGPLTSKVLSTVAAATSSYFMNRHWSFRHRANTGLRREYTLFFALNGIGLAIALAVIALVRYALGHTGVLALNAANVVGVLLGTIFRFFAYKRWVFVAHDHPLATAVAEGEIATAPLEEPVRRV